MNISDLTLIVAAGGKSSRMGRDKRFLPMDGEPLLARTLRKSRAAGFRAIVLAAEGVRSDLSALAEEFGATLVTDEQPAQGPAAAIAAGLAAAETEWSLVLSGDMPFYDFELVRALLSAAEGDTQVVLPTLSGYWQPLAALYRRDAGAVFAAAIARGDRKLGIILRELAVQELALTVDAGLFFNVNTPAALRLARGRAANLVRRVPIVSIVAPASGTGKTTFVEKLLPLLTARGVCVGVVKSDAHGIVLNDEAKDSGRFRAAGAASVAVVAPAGFWLYERTQEKLSLEVAAARMTDVDLVLIETRSHGVFPALSLWRELEEPLLDERVAAFFSSCHERQAEGILQLDLEAMEDAAHLAIFLMGREDGFDLHRIAWDGGHSGKGGT